MSVNYQVRYANNPEGIKTYTTEQLRSEFLVENLFIEDQISMVYSHYDRYIVGGVKPFSESVLLSTIDPLKATFFLERREIGIINVGGKGQVIVEDEVYDLNFKEALYIGKGKKRVHFQSFSEKSPAKFYFNSAPAHQSFPIKKIGSENAEIVKMGSFETSNARTIKKLIVNSIVDTCQLQMGMTELESGSVWNTMPAHVHDRRMEIYFYFEVPESQAICHFMGQPQETRHLWVQNESAIISPPWSVHTGAGTSNYTFIWGMAGENMDYGDMDMSSITDLK